MRNDPAVKRADANPLSGSDLSAFVAAVDASSVSGAADALGLTQSAVTKRLQSLERRVGVRLFDRGRFGLRPTGAAQLMYPEARNALDALRRTEQVATDPTGTEAVALPLAASFTVGEFLLPGWLAAFRIPEPTLRARVDVTNSPAVLRAVRDGQAQIGFVEGIDALDGLRSLLLLRDELRVTVAHDHRWAGRRSLRPAELAGEPYVARETVSGTRAVADAALARIGVSLLPTLEVASTQGVQRALASGGFALQSPLSLADVGDTLVTIPVRGLDVRRELRAVHVGRTPPTPLARRFWRWLQENAAGEPAGAA